MKISKLMIVLAIIMSFMLIGAPIKYNCKWLNIAIIIIGIILAIYKILIKKEKVKIEKIDIIMFIFYITPVIPLIAGTCSNIEQTVIALIRNISLFTIYFEIKEILKEKIENENIITSVILIGGIILVIFGIDEMTTRFVEKYINLVGLPNVLNYEHRMFSTLGYTNSFAIIMAIETLICLYKIKQKKEIYSGLSYVFLSALLLSYSRGVLAIFILTFAIYLIYKRKEKIYTTYILGANLILACVYIELFEKLVSNNSYILVWISLLCIFGLSILIAKLISKKYENIVKIRGRTYLFIVIILIALAIIAYQIGKKLDTPLQIYNDYNESNGEIRRVVYNIQPNKEYNFIFDIEANSRLKTIDNYKISITEEDKYCNTINTHEVSFNTFNGKKEINFTSSDETVLIVVRFKSMQRVGQKGLKINSLVINEDEFALNYLYLPYRLVERLQSVGTKQKSVTERLVFYKDALKIIKENWLFGTGANGWRYNYEKVRSYEYDTTEVHSYLLQIFIENGIVSVVMWFIIIVVVIYKLIKRKQFIDEIDIAFIILNLHSLMDFDMSFYLIMLIWVALFEIVVQKNDKQVKRLGAKNE